MLTINGKAGWLENGGTSAVDGATSAIDCGVCTERPGQTPNGAGAVLMNGTGLFPPDLLANDGDGLNFEPGNTGTAASS